MDENNMRPDVESILAEEVAVRRSEVVQTFKMDFSVDDIPDVETHYDDESVADAPISEVEDEAVSVPGKHTSQKSGGCLLKLLYGILIVGISGFLAAIMLFFVLDSMAINRPQKRIDVEVVAGFNTQDIANMLADNGIIEYPFCFRLYSKFTGSDGKWQVGAFTLSPDMDYSTLVDTLQTMTPRPTVTVTIPEGKTVEEIADILETNGVCKAEDFYQAVVYGDYDFDFVKAIPRDENGRIYPLEGYLFPDTYNFYLDSTGETVVTRMLDNFDKKLTPEIRQMIADRGWTIDQAIIIASLVEGEAASKEDMEKVSKVLQNRMAPNSGYPKLELCSTRDYVKALDPTLDELEVIVDAYNTYNREGLPVGAINNPGLQAILAALNPSTEKGMEKCYFFATDYNTGITYFSKTFSEHERICRKYKIGMYG